MKRTCSGGQENVDGVKRLVKIVKSPLFPRISGPGDS